METPFEDIINKIRCSNYDVKKLFMQDSMVRLIELSSNTLGYDFLIEIPSSKTIDKQQIDSQDFSIIEESDNDYKNHRQREYLKNIQIENIVCKSKKNFTIKNKNIYRCYLIDYFLPSDAENISDIENENANENEDIEIDDFPVENIFPIFDINDFTENLDNFSETLIEIYAEITETEEMMNEQEVIKLLEKFDEQKTQLKERIFHIHQNAYNLRRDISKTGENLNRIFALKYKSQNSSDRVRFKIDRMASETQEQIHKLKNKLSQQRNKADNLLKKYWNYIGKFDQIE